MQRKTLALILAGSLLAAGLLTAAATDLAPGAPTFDRTASSSSPAADVPGACAANDHTLAFPGDATVEGFTGNAAGASTMKLDLTAWHGGVAVTTWAKDTWKVEVAIVNDTQDRLQPQVDGAVQGDTLEITATVQDTRSQEVLGHRASVTVGHPQAHLKVHVPDLHVASAILHDEPDWNGAHLTVGQPDAEDVTPPWNDTDEEERFPVLARGLQGARLEVDADNTPTHLEDVSFDEVVVSSDNGHVTAGSLTASTAKLAADNGNVCLHDSTTESIGVDTDNGDVVLASLRVVDLAVTTDNGNVQGLLVPTASGSIQADTDNGNVVLQVPTGDAYGYDAHARTDNGDIRIDLPNADTDTQGGDGEGKKVTARTHSFDTRDIQVNADITTDNGSIVLGSG